MSNQEIKLQLESLTQRANVVWAKAWGKEWPFKTSEVDWADLVESDDETDDADDVYGSFPDEKKEKKWEYRCLLGMHDLKQTLAIEPLISDSLVVLKEYEEIYKSMHEENDTSYINKKHYIVITGQPGIGKTMFLIYVFIRRLQEKRPTVVPFGRNEYFIFDGDGAGAHLPVRLPKLQDCWALFDSNDDNPFPGHVFQTEPVRVIQTTSPNPERWKWLDQKISDGGWYIVNLPTLLEIGAVIKENKLDARRTWKVVRKWGPSIQVVRRVIAEESAYECGLEVDAAAAAEKICDNIRSIRREMTPRELPHLVLYLRPNHKLHENGKIRPETAIPIIPTAFLRSLLHEALESRSHSDALRILGVLDLCTHPKGTHERPHKKRKLSSLSEEDL